MCSDGMYPRYLASVKRSATLITEASGASDRKGKPKYQESQCNLMPQMLFSSKKMMQCLSRYQIKLTNSRDVARCDSCTFQVDSPCRNKLWTHLQISNSNHINASTCVICPGVSEMAKASVGREKWPPIPTRITNSLFF